MYTTVNMSEYSHMHDSMHMIMHQATTGNYSSATTSTYIPTVLPAAVWIKREE